MNEYSYYNASPRLRRSLLKSVRLMNIVAAHYGIPVKDILGSDRFKKVAHARHILFFLLRNMLDLTFIDAAYFVGGRDHTTAIHSYRKIELELIDDELQENVNAIKEKYLMKSH